VASTTKSAAAADSLEVCIIYGIFVFVYATSLVSAFTSPQARVS